MRSNTPENVFHLSFSTLDIAFQGVETIYEGTPVFLSIPGVNVITVWSTRNDIMDSLVTTCTYSIDTFARSHVKLEWMTPSVGGFVESEESFLTLRGVTDVFFPAYRSDIGSCRTW